jgi:hypothetical protein
MGPGPCCFDIYDAVENLLYLFRVKLDRRGS